MWRSNALPLLLVLAACGDEGEGVCAQRTETYHVTATVSVPDAVKSAGDVKLRVSVSQDRGITACRGGLVSVTSPAPDLLSNVPHTLSEDRFMLDVPSTFYPELDVSALMLEVLLDENGNGRCDDGEPRGATSLPRATNVSVSVALSRAPCPGLRL